MTYADHLNAETASWLISDPKERAEKFRRERIRHYKLARDLLLDKLGTDSMDIIEIGGGPMPLSDILSFRHRTVIDPLSSEYASVIACPDHVGMQGEHISGDGWSASADLVICTNALDHTENPQLVVENVAEILRPGGYFAVMCAENNAITNPHPAHEHNLTANTIHHWLDADFETVWELNYRENGYRYGWPMFEGKRGQPAFALLLRKCTDYQKEPND